MRELMLEILCYEPFGKFQPEEEKYIDKILSGNVNPPQTTLHTLFSGFYSCVQNKKFEDIGWLQKWKAAHGRAKLPLLFKKICFYLLVKGGLSQSDFVKQIGLHASYIKKWGISPQFCKYAEADTYSTIKIFRNGVKKRYIVSTVKQLYYEVGRQASESKAQSKKESMTLKDLPQFVDVFAGSASVAASVVTEGCPPPIINDYDPIMVCFAWSFVHCKSELRKRIVDFHDYVINRELKGLSYGEADYEGHNKKSTIYNSPKVLDESQMLLWLYRDCYHRDIEKIKMLAQSYQEFIMRIRSSYKDVKEVLDLCNRNNLRHTNFNQLSPHSITQIEDVLDYALALFYYYSFEPGGPTGNAYHEFYINASSYFSYLNRLVNLDAISRNAEDVKARELAGLQLEASSLILESDGHFSRYLQDAKFYSKDFRSLLQITPSDAIYYWDSPYYLTTGYAVGFSDKDHKDMLDILRGAEFKWVFSMQYNSSDKCKCSSSSRKSQPHIIKDYGAYYRGFYAPFRLAADQRTYYVSTDAPMDNAKNLYVILFDFDKVKKKWPEMKTKTKEMLVVNFNPLRTVPLHDSAVVYPFGLFLQCADKKMKYQAIVEKAVVWRKDNIESKYADEIPV